MQPNQLGTLKPWGAILAVLAREHKKILNYTAPAQGKQRQGMAYKNELSVSRITLRALQSACGITC